MGGDATENDDDRGDVRLPRRGKLPPVEGARARLLARIAPGGLTTPGDEPDDLAGERGRYRLCRLIGRGGMGEVWEGVAIDTGERVAVKQLQAAAAAHEPTRRRFIREARTAASVVHPHIVHIMDVGTTRDGVPFIVMELLDGHTLDQELRHRGALPWPRARAVLLQVLDALAHAHARGVIHRDLKPANVMLVDDGASVHCKIIDFGLAKREIISSASEAFSRTGEVFGSPPFMSPEQFRGRKVDARSDIYSFGCLMFHILTGNRPFPGTAVGELMYQHLFEPAPSPRVFDCPEAIAAGLKAIVLRAMRKTPENRFASAVQLAAALRRLDHDPRPVEVPPDDELPTRILSPGRSDASWRVMALFGVGLLSAVVFIAAYGTEDSRAAVELDGQDRLPATRAAAVEPAAEMPPSDNANPDAGVAQPDTAGKPREGSIAIQPVTRAPVPKPRRREKTTRPSTRRETAGDERELPRPPRTDELPPNPFGPQPADRGR